jgi:hypothetical protein
VCRPARREKSEPKVNDQEYVHYPCEDVEYPTCFTQTAINIVASKYFYGDVAAGSGSPGDGKREFSFAQLVYRVVESIAEFGLENGYFDEENSRIFADELAWLLLNQHGSFNSPVWFNVGLGRYGLRAGNSDNHVWGAVKLKADDRYPDQLPGGAVTIQKVDPYERPQASACFIIEARDSIKGIWEMMGESARLLSMDRVWVPTGRVSGPPRTSSLVVACRPALCPLCASKTPQGAQSRRRKGFAN